MPDHLTDSVRNLLNLTQQELDSFITRYSQSPDHIQPVESGGSIHYGGFPYNADLYQQTSFRLISETQFELPGPWITEKTWTTIANHHPFIMASNSGTLDRLERVGIKTFKNYLEIPDYENIINTNDRISAIVENTKFWSKNIHKQHEEIGQDVKHNVEVFSNLAKTNLDTIRSVCDQLEVGHNNIYRLLPIHDITNRPWIIFYESVRDKSWPDCWSESDFIKLPLHIQQECIQVHNYQYKVDKS